MKRNRFTLSLAEVEPLLKDGVTITASEGCYALHEGDKLLRAYVQQTDGGKFETYLISRAAFDGLRKRGKIEFVQTIGRHAGLWKAKAN